jgi:phosphoribosyl 1,2-cyclic phosphodiesterase
LCYSSALRGEDRIVKICILASSSAGNSIFIGTEHTRLLVDAGLSRKEIMTRLRAIGESADALDAVLVTHEHSDHICGLVPLLKKYKLPVYVSWLTAPTMPWGDYEPRLESFMAGERFRIGDIEVDTFTIPHDAADPVGFCIQAEGVRVGVVTDLGYMPDSVRIHLRGTEFLVLESNHDIEMLKVDPYPWSVKQRVMGRNGHLSNDMVSQFILDGMDGCLKTLVLGHLSEHNNHPAIVHMSAVQALGRRGLTPNLVVSEPRLQSEVFTV